MADDMEPRGCKDCDEPMTHNASLQLECIPCETDAEIQSLKVKLDRRTSALELIRDRSPNSWSVSMAKAGLRAAGAELKDVSSVTDLHNTACESCSEDVKIGEGVVFDWVGGVWHRKCAEAKQVIPCHDCEDGWKSIDPDVECKECQGDGVISLQEAEALMPKKGEK